MAEPKDKFDDGDQAFPDDHHHDGMVARKRKLEG